MELEAKKYVWKQQAFQLHLHESVLEMDRTIEVDGGRTSTTQDKAKTVVKIKWFWNELKLKWRSLNSFELWNFGHAVPFDFPFLNVN